MAADSDLTSRTLRRNFGRNLRVAREQKGLSQVQLAELVGTGQSAISSIESGRFNLTIETMTRLAESVGLAVPDLLADPKPAQASLYQVISSIFNKPNNSTSPIETPESDDPQKSSSS